ncbi:MAG: M17 family peptidase N-terminal domain-containing protein [Blastocatellia bacterium]
MKTANASKAGETVYLHNPGNIAARRLLLLGAGKLADYNTDIVRRMLGFGGAVVAREEACAQGCLSASLAIAAG